MPKYQLKIENPSVDGVTGHHTVEVYIIEQADSGDAGNGGGSVETILGIKEKYGIESSALDLRYGGDVNQWLADVGREMLEKHQRRRSAHHELANLHGKTIDL